jgi:hypothetical protein
MRITSPIHNKGFVIDGLTRTGSTTLASLLSCHPDISCLVEPFHPRRYEGQFHKMAIAHGSVEPALTLIWFRWTGIKHVWESNGWPFVNNPELNDGVVLGARKVVFLQRKNLLRRCISSWVSRQLGFWIGTRDEFCSRLEGIQLSDLEPGRLHEQIQRDKAAVERRLEVFCANNIETMTLFYEDLYGEDVDCHQQLGIVNRVFVFLGFDTIAENVFTEQWKRLLDPDIYRWSNPEVYRRIPGIQQIESRVGSSETGWLFK